MIPDVSLSNLSGLKPGDANDPKAVAAKVQGMFMEVMLKAMEDSVDAEDGLFGGSASSDIYRGMFREQLAGAMSTQMNSPLETQLKKAFDKASEKVSAAAAASETKEDQAPTLPVPGVVSSPQGCRPDPINGH